MENSKNVLSKSQEETCLGPESTPPPPGLTPRTEAISVQCQSGKAEEKPLRPTRTGMYTGPRKAIWLLLSRYWGPKHYTNILRVCDMESKTLVTSDPYCRLFMLGLRLI